MNSNMINSFSLVGNIASVNEIKKQSNGKKFRYFTLAQNNKYNDQEGNPKSVPSFISIKIYEKNFAKFENILKVGNYVNIFGKVGVYKDAEAKSKLYLVAIEGRQITYNKNSEESFEYDWLSDESELEL